MKNKIEKISVFSGLFIGGLAYWFQPYNQATVLGINMWLIMSVGAFIISMLQMIFLLAKPPKIALLVSLGVVIAVLVRIIYDIAFWDSTAHNLAPFEILFTCVVTISCAFIGAYLGLFIKKHLK